MPFKTKNRLDQNWWGIERKVGRFLGSPRADVMLVQTLLNAIQQTENGGVFVVWSVPPPRDPLVVDGFCGPITNDWIPVVPASSGSLSGRHRRSRLPARGRSHHRW